MTWLYSCLQLARLLAPRHLPLPFSGTIPRRGHRKTFSLSFPALSLVASASCVPPPHINQPWHHAKTPSPLGSVVRVLCVHSLAWHGCQGWGRLGFQGAAGDEEKT